MIEKETRRMKFIYSATNMMSYLTRAMEYNSPDCNSFAVEVRNGRFKIEPNNIPDDKQPEIIVEAKENFYQQGFQRSQINRLIKVLQAIQEQPMTMTMRDDTSSFGVSWLEI